MESDINNIIFSIVNINYQENQILSETNSCSAEKHLPCNCLTGIIINYWAFAYNNCIKSLLDFSFKIYQNNVTYVASSYNSKKLIPIIPDDSEEYFLNSKICTNDNVSTEQVYINGKLLFAVNDLGIKLEDILSKKKYSESSQILYILAYFFPVTRICSLEDESFLLLFMTTFMFPNRTMKMVYDYYSKSATKEEKKFIFSFLQQYESFITSLDSEEYGFFIRFSYYFEKYTTVSIDEWIEKINKKTNPNFFYRTLIGAYNRNVEELKRRSSYFRKIKELYNTEMDTLDEGTE